MVPPAVKLQDIEDAEYLLQLDPPVEYICVSWCIQVPEFQASWDRSGRSADVSEVREKVQATSMFPKTQWTSGAESLRKTDYIHLYYIFIYIQNVCKPAGSWSHIKSGLSSHASTPRGVLCTKGAGPAGAHRHHGPPEDPSRQATVARCGTLKMFKGG